MSVGIAYQLEQSFSLFADVAIPVPLRKTFSYGIPQSFGPIEPGMRVQVRFGTRVLLGCVVSITHELPVLPDKAQIQPLLRIVDDEPALTKGQLKLARWISDYYLAYPGIVYRSFLPPETPLGISAIYERDMSKDWSNLRARSLARKIWDVLDRPRTARNIAKALGKKSVAGTLRSLLSEGFVRQKESENRDSVRKIRTAIITENGRTALEKAKLHPTSVRILTLLSIASVAVPLSTIRHELNIGSSTFLRLSKRGFIQLAYQTVLRSPWARLKSAAKKDLNLTDVQKNVLHVINRAIVLRKFHVAVIHGVTGSGKTEVYLRAAKTVLEQGRTVLILVPEIALTPHLARLLYGRFSGRVAILHSALGSGERQDEWWRIRRGQAQVVVGARAAVLAPLENLGLVVVDEEHEASYKQEESPRYNARDVAILRAKHEGAVVLLGSATPSIESYAHAENGHYELLELPDRVEKRPLAAVELVDMKTVAHEEGPETIFSRPLREAIERCFSANEQVIVLLNRRGFAGQLLCRACGMTLTCTECSVSLTLHRGGSLAVCHYCGLGRPTPKTCDVCNDEYLHTRGFGTERIESLAKEMFPENRIARMDRDTMRKKGSYEALLNRFSTQKIDMLVGTQMIAKGHDFPALTLVGVLAADIGLGAPDFRAAERTFQLLTQVAGRAGRGDLLGKVFIQTYTPEHYSLRFAREQDFVGFYEEERRFRRVLSYPPVTQLINILFEAKGMAEAMHNARRVASFLRDARLDDVDVLGPAFAVRAKVSGRYRCQILVKLPRYQRTKVRGYLLGVLDDSDLSRTMLVDVDPQSLS